MNLFEQLGHVPHSSGSPRSRGPWLRFGSAESGSRQGRQFTRSAPATLTVQPRRAALLPRRVPPAARRLVAPPSRLVAIRRSQTRHRARSHASASSCAPCSSATMAVAAGPRDRRRSFTIAQLEHIHGSRSSGRRRPRSSSARAMLNAAITVASESSTAFSARGTVGHSMDGNGVTPSDDAFWRRRCNSGVRARGGIREICTNG